MLGTGHDNLSAFLDPLHRGSQALGQRPDGDHGAVVPDLGLNVGGPDLKPVQPQLNPGIIGSQNLLDFGTLLGGDDLHKGSVIEVGAVVMFRHVNRLSSSCPILEREEKG